MNLNLTVAVCPVRRASIPDSVPDMDSIAAACLTTRQWITGWYPGATVVEWWRMTTSASNSRVAFGSSCPSIATIPCMVRVREGGRQTECRRGRNYYVGIGPLGCCCPLWDRTKNVVDPAIARSVDDARQMYFIIACWMRSHPPSSHIGRVTMCTPAADKPNKKHALQQQYLCTYFPCMGKFRVCSISLSTVRIWLALRLWSRSTHLAEGGPA